MEEYLPVQQFVKVHKSFIVALRHIRSLKPDNIVLANKVNVPVSANYSEQVMEKFKR